MSTSLVFFFNDTATTEIYTLSLHDALPISVGGEAVAHLLDVGVDAEDLLDDHEPAPRLARRVGAIRGELVAVFSRERYDLAHRPSPFAAAPRTAGRSSRPAPHRRPWSDASRDRTRTRPTGVPDAGLDDCPTSRDR